MFIHLGDNKQVSDEKIIGIFNVDTLKMSDDNSFYLKQCEDGDKTAAVSDDGSCVFSKVSPFTVTKRNSIEDDFIWIKEKE